jgi:hypothetical protein
MTKITICYGVTMDRDALLDRIRDKCLLMDLYKLVTIKHPKPEDEIEEEEESVTMTVRTKGFGEEDDDDREEDDEKLKEEAKIEKERKRKRMTLVEREEENLKKASSKKKKYKHIEDPKLVKTSEIESIISAEESEGRKVKVADVDKFDYDQHFKTLDDIKKHFVLQEFSYSDLELGKLFADSEEIDDCCVYVKSTLIKPKKIEDTYYTLRQVDDEEFKLFLHFLDYDEETFKPNWLVITNK